MLLCVLKDMEMAACAPLKKMSDFEIQSLVSNVKDLLPDLGDGFIEVRIFRHVSFQYCTILGSNLSRVD